VDVERRPHVPRSESTEDIDGPFAVADRVPTDRLNDRYLPGQLESAGVAAERNCVCLAEGRVDHVHRAEPRAAVYFALGHEGKSQRLEKIAKTHVGVRRHRTDPDSAVERQ